jgi:WD40 repeat protein
MPPAKKNSGPLTQVKVLPNTQQLSSVRYSPDGKMLAAGSFEAVVRRWDASTDAFTELPALAGHNGWVQSLAFHPDGKRLFTADSWGQVCCWPFTEKEAKPLWSVKDAHDGWIYQLALSPDGSRLATAGRDSTIRITNTDDGKEVARFREHKEHVLAVAFHPDGKHLVSGDLKGVVKQWELSSGKVVREFDAKSMFLRDRIQDVGGVRCFAFDKTVGTLFVGGSLPKSGGFVQGTWLVLVFDWASGKLTNTQKGGTENDGYVYDMAFHPGGYLMAVTSGQPGQGKLLFLRPAEAQPFHTQAGMANCHAIALHPDSKRIVVCATNANSAGNGRQIGKNKEYPGNYSPLYVFDVTKAS